MQEEWPEAEQLQYATWNDANRFGIKRLYELHGNTHKTVLCTHHDKTEVQ